MKKLTQEEFLEKVKIAIGNDYDFTDTIYTGVKNYVDLKCNKHGPIRKRAENLLRGKGCTECGALACVATKLKVSKEKFQETAEKIHGVGTYGFHFAEYVSAHQKVKMWCYEHGLFEIAPAILHYGVGCPKCAWAKNGAACKSNTEDFLRKAKDLHGENAFTWSKVNYVDAHTKITLGCHDHGDFTIKPCQILRGASCPRCSTKGYRKHLPGSLYVMVCGDLTKIGISNKRTTLRRHNVSTSFGEEFQILKEFKFENGSTPLEIEQYLLKKLRMNYTQPKYKFDGYKECFYGLNNEKLLAEIDEIIMEKQNGGN